MPAEKSTKRVKTSAILVRMKPEVRKILDEEAAAAEAELQKQHPTASLGLGPYLIDLGLRAAEARKAASKPKKG
jgi:hypothetical protein